jgi:hypothetical protein
VRYRTLSIADVHDIAETAITGEHVATDHRVVERGDGDAADLTDLDKVIDAFRSELESTPPKDNELFEGRLAAAVYPYFSGIPVEVLDDPGFWRYLAASRFMWFIRWREADPISNGNFKNLVDLSKPAEQIPFRLYLRAKAVDVDGDVAIAGQIPRSTDFWRSHITRVRVSTAPRVARSFAEAKRDDTSGRLTTSRLRAAAKRVNRAWTNVSLDLYDSQEAAEFIAEVINEHDGR